MSTHPDDCRHWIDVYSELIAFKQEVLDRMERATRELPDPGPAEVGYDLEISQIEFARLRRRREFWEHRQAELRGR